MRNFRAVLLTLAALTLAATPAFAATETTTMAVSATVTEACQVSASSLAFGTYNPLAGDVDGEATISVTCTSGTSAWIGLGEGANPDDGSSPAAPVRRMTDGTAFLRYDLYSDSNRSTAWTDEQAGGVAFTGTGAAEEFTVYGTIPGGQSVPAGAYTDTVVVTVNF